VRIRHFGFLVNCSRASNLVLAKHWPKGRKWAIPLQLRARNSNKTREQR
jgi:hypothetical protein